MATASSDPLSLRNTGAYGDAIGALRRISSGRHLQLGEEVLQAELHSLTGDVSAAIASATQLLDRRGLSASQAGSLLGVLGTSCFRRGQHRRGVEHLLRGIAVAESSKDLALECRLRLSLLRNQNHYVGPEQPAAEIAALKRKVHRLADPSTVLQLQLALAELAAKLGLITRAKSHLETAQSLLGRTTDIALQAEVKLGQVALAALECNLAEALGHANDLLAMAQKTRSESATFGALTNLGHLSLMQSRFTEARSG